MGSSAELSAYPFPPKPLRPIPLHVRVKLQDGIHGHFHDHDDDWMLEERRPRRSPDDWDGAVIGGEIAYPPGWVAPPDYPVGGGVPPLPVAKPVRDSAEGDP